MGETRALVGDFVGMLPFAPSLVVIIFYVARNFILDWLSIIFGLVLCYYRVISSKNYFMPLTCYGFWWVVKGLYFM